ncbi:MAG: hypothetical protein ACRD2C_14720 [Acidimicrobiales bacterium]
MTDLRTTMDQLGGAGWLLLAWLPGALVLIGAVRVVAACRRGSSLLAVAVATLALVVAVVSALLAIAEADLHHDLGLAEFDDDIEAIFADTPLVGLSAALGVASLAAGILLVAWASRWNRPVPRSARLLVGLIITTVLLGCTAAALGLFRLDAEHFEAEYFDSQEILDRAILLGVVGSVVASSAALAAVSVERRQRPTGTARILSPSGHTEAGGGGGLPGGGRRR